MHYNSKFGFLSSLISVVLIHANILFWLFEYFIHHVNALSRNVVTSCALFIVSSLIFFVSHTTSHKNENYSRSSNLVPLKIGSLISSTILLLGGGGGCGVGGVGGVGGGGWGKLKIPWILMDSSFYELSGWKGEYCEVT